MMRYVLIGMTVLLNTSIAHATAPTSVTIDYNIKSNNLYVRAEHVSSRLERHYIRKMVVSINDEAKDPVYYPRQKAPWGFEADYTVKAKPKDKILPSISNP